MLYDDNGISIDGKTSLTNSVDQLARFRSAGWRALRIDGHDQRAILRALRAAKRADKPTLIACKTTIGFGLPTRAGTAKAHGEAPGAAEIAGARAALNWPYEPFVVPTRFSPPGARPGRAAGGAGRNGGARSRRSPPSGAPNSSAGCAAICPRRSTRRWRPTSAKLAAEAPEIATRKAGEAASR